MNEKPRSSSCFVLAISAPISFILGLIIGLVVLGWWLWPVEWSGGDLSMLDPGSQMDYLSAAVSSYAYDQDEAVAQSRFANLGDERNAVLTALYTAEPARSANIEAFAAAVGASSALTTPSETQAVETAAAEGGSMGILESLLAQPVLTIGAVCLGLVLLVALLLILALSRRRRQKTGAEPGAAETAQPEFSPPSPPYSVYESPATQAEAQPSAETTPGAGEDILPDWLNIPETQTDPYQTVQLGDTDRTGVTTTPQTGQAAVMEESIEELPVSTDEELTDDDIAAITSEKFPPTVTLGGAAIFGDAVPSEGIHFPGSTGQTDVDETQIATDFWLESNAEEPSVTPPTDWFETVEPQAAGEIISLPPFKADETQLETEAKFSHDIEAIPGITPEEGLKLRNTGVNVPLLLLHRGATAQGRQALAQESGLDEHQLYKWVTFLDLYRIKGVDQNSAELLNAAGVEGVSGLAGSDPASLYQQIRDIMQTYQIDPSALSLDVIAAWIDQAKKLPPLS